MVQEDGVKLVAIGKIHHYGEGCACPMGVLAREFLEKLRADGTRVVVDTDAGIEHFGRGGGIGMRHNSRGGGPKLRVGPALPEDLGDGVHRRPVPGHGDAGEPGGAFDLLAGMACRSWLHDAGVCISGIKFGEVT